MISTYRNGSGDYMAKYFINLLGNCCELFIILYFLKDNYKPRFPRTTFVPLCVVLVVFQFLNTNLFLAESQFVSIGSLLFTLLVMLLFPLKPIQYVLYTPFIFLINALSEAAIGLTLSMIFDINITYIHKNILLFSVCTVTSKFLTYIIVLLTKRKRFKTDIEALKQYILFIFLLPIASILIMMLFLRCCYQIDDTSFHIITLITSIVLAFANIAVFYIIDKQNEHIETKEKLLFAEKHINNQVVHYQELYKHQNELRIFRHDIRNRLLSLIGLIKDNETEKALQTMESSLDWLNQKTNNIVNSGNPVIDAILQSKLHLAKDKGIIIDIYIKISENIKIDEIELGIILGNALDNAIEAVEYILENNNKHIEFKMITVADRISVSIKNPVNKNIDTNKLFSTKSDKELHGYGIKSIKTISQKYDGMVLFSCEDKIFTININLGNYAAT